MAKKPQTLSVNTLSKARPPQIHTHGCYDDDDEEDSIAIVI